jgi:hypothetical protein
MPTHDCSSPAGALIANWLAGRLATAPAQWYAGQLARIAARPGDGTALAVALGLAARKLGKADLACSPDELAAAGALRQGWDPSCWSVDQAARVSFLLAAFDGDEAAFRARLQQMADSAELNELIALYRGFPLYPAAAALAPQARAAIRSSMKPIFEAIAHRNPYPLERFDDAAWNQMIVKTFFLESPLWAVQGLERRANPALAGILVDLAHERWAAGRAVSPELWRCVAAHADGAGHAAMQRVLESGAPAERMAVCLALDGVAGDDARQLRRLCERQGLTATAAVAGWAGLSPFT